MNKKFIKKFEYKIVEGSEDFIPEKDEKWLNSGGEEGWELVFVVLGRARGRGLAAGNAMYYFFKREVSEDISKTES